PPLAQGRGELPEDRLGYDLVSFRMMCYLSCGKAAQNRRRGQLGGRVGGGPTVACAAVTNAPCGVARPRGAARRRSWGASSTKRESRNASSASASRSAGSAPR